MNMLFAIYVIAIMAIITLGVVAVRSVTKRQPVKKLDRIAQLQQWEYLRSLTRDGKE